MKSIRTSHSHEYHFFEKHEVLPALDLDSALRFLRRFSDDAGAMMALRKMSSQTLGRKPSQGLSDDDAVLHHVAQMLASGQLTVAMAHQRLKGPPHTAETQAPRTAQPPGSKKEALGHDDATFGNSHVAKQVATLKDAANQGIPFCERCERTAQQREAA